MTTKKGLSTDQMVETVVNVLSHICGHDRDLDDALLVGLEADLAQCLKSIRSSIRYRQMKCTTIYPEDMD